eukprot:403367531
MQQQPPQPQPQPQQQAPIEEEEDEAINPDDLFNIMISTDNHIGYKENDRIRSNDSFLAFQEVLAIANQTPNLDFLMLGGDLFHEHKPSRKTNYKLQEMMNSYVFGEQNIKFMTYQYKEANYMNPNLSVKLPIFIIHGNHDDPSGLEYLSNIDLLNSNNYVNYFGKVTNIEDIEVVPILFQKGKTKIALYGIGHMKDERLNLAFENKKIKFKRPLKDKDEWFNILVLHQNKFKGAALGCSRRNSITEGMIPKFFHLVIWAHEHESIPQVMECHENSVHFLQPGSTVATSLIQAESKDKHCFFLQVHKQSFKIQAVRLQNTRPFAFDSIELSRVQPKLDPKNNAQIEDFLVKKLEQMLSKVENNNKIGELKLPLLRLKIEYSEFGVFKSKKITDLFLQRVANNQDFLQFYRKTGFISGNGSQAFINGQNQIAKVSGTLEMNLIANGGSTGLFGIEEEENQYLLQNIFKKTMKEHTARGTTLGMIPSGKMATQVEKYVNSNDVHGLETFFDHEVFRKSYNEIKKQTLEMVNSKRSYREIQDELERLMRTNIKDFLSKQFIEDQDEEEDQQMNQDTQLNPHISGGVNGLLDSEMLDNVEQQRQTYQSLKRQNYTIRSNANALATNNSENLIPPDMFKMGKYASTLGNQSVIKQVIHQQNEDSKDQYVQDRMEYDTILNEHKLSQQLSQQPTQNQEGGMKSQQEQQTIGVNNRKRVHSQRDQGDDEMMQMDIDLK